MRVFLRLFKPCSLLSWNLLQMTCHWISTDWTQFKNFLRVNISIILKTFPNFIEDCIVSGKKLKQISLTLLMIVFMNVFVSTHVAFIYLRIKTLECMQCQWEYPVTWRWNIVFWDVTSFASIVYKTSRCHIPENNNFPSHCLDNDNSRLAINHCFQISVPNSEFGFPLSLYLYRLNIPCSRRTWINAHVALMKQETPSTSQHQAPINS